MLCGHEPFEAEYVKDLIDKIKKGEYEFHEESSFHISDEAKDLIHKLL